MACSFFLWWKTKLWLIFFTDVIEKGFFSILKLSSGQKILLDDLKNEKILMVSKMVIEFLGLTTIKLQKFFMGMCVKPRMWLMQVSKLWHLPNIFTKYDIFACVSLVHC